MNNSSSSSQSKPEDAIDTVAVDRVVETLDLLPAQTLRQASEQGYVSLVETLPVGIFRTDASGKGIYHNNRWYQIAGVSPEAARGNGWIQSLHPEDRDRVPTEWQKSIQEHRPFQLEYRFQRPDGRVTWVYGQATAERDTQGQIIGYAGTLTDISDRKQAEIQLELQNALLAKVANNEPLVNILNATIDAVEKILNGAICSVLLLGADNRLRCGAAPNLPPEYNQNIEGMEIGEGEGSCGTAAFRNETIIVADIATDPLWQDCKEFALRYGLQACWSSPINSNADWVLGTFAVYYNQPRSPQPHEIKSIGQIAKIIGIAIEREQSQAALRESQSRWQFALEGAGDGLWDWHVQTNKTFFSKQWKAMLGYDDHEVKDLVTEWESRIYPDDRDLCFSELDRYFKGQIPIYEVEHRVQCKDKSYKWILTRGKVIEQTADGQPLRMIGTHTDIDDRKQAEHQLQTLIEGTAATTGEDYFPALASQIAKALNVSYALVTEKVDDKLNILAFWANDSLQSTFAYPIAATPCQQALEQGQYYCESLVQEKFPVDLDLVEMAAESYLGISLKDAQGQAIGNLCILDQNPIEDPHRAENLLRVFAARAAAELERERSAQALAQLNQSLEQRVSERTAQLQKSEQRYRALMNGASDAIVLANAQGYLTEGNQAAELLLGYSQPELSHLHLSDLHPPEVLAAAQATFRDLFGQDRISPVLETIVLRKDGSQVPVEIKAICIEVDGERIVQGIFRDITQRKQAAVALEASEAELRSLFMGMDDLVFVVDRVGTYLKVASTNPKQIMAPAESVLGKNIQDFFSPEQAAQFLRTIEQTLTTQQTQSCEYSLTIDQIEYWFNAKCSPLDDRSVIWVARDITEQKALLVERQAYQRQLEYSNAELLRATRLKDEFLANMSHELRTPLNAILGLSESLLEEVFGAINDRQKKAISTVERSGQHLLSLINDILEVSKIEAGKLELDITTVSATTLTNSTLAFVKQLAQQKQIQLTTAFAPNLGNIDVDERRIRQVLINLLNNAVKFTPAGGRVTLAVQIEQAEFCLLPTSTDLRQQVDPGTWILFTVTDTGIGITPENQSKLFKPFVQIDGSLNRQYQGTGLGLTLVKQIVELHGGLVTLTSEFGQGSCFTVRLPYHAAAAQRTISSPEPTPSLSITDEYLPSIEYPLILLAEDNQDNIDTFSGYLEACNYRLIVANNGHEVISTLKSCINTPADLPDLILMDIQMPGMDGLETMQRIRQDLQLTDLPIIALTALAMTGDREKCLAAGANDYLTKPLQLKQLRANIQRLIPAN